MVTTEIVKRLTPSKETLNKIFAVSGNQCAFPDCNHPLFDEDYDFIAEVCHIEAAMPLGERFNKTQTNEQRRSFDNLMAMCKPHHVKTDNVDKYPTPVLQAMKREHEANFVNPALHFDLSDAAITQVHDRLEKMYQDIQIIKKDTAEIKGIVTDSSFKIDEMMNLMKVKFGDDNKLNKEYERQLKLITVQLESGQAVRALQQLLELKAAIWPDINDQLKFQIETNIGYCYHLRQDDAKTAASLIAAYAFQPDSETALSNIANAYIILNQEDIAFSYMEKYQQQYPDSLYMLSLWIRFNALKLSIDNLLKKIPSKKRESGEVVLSLGVAAKRQGNLALALEYFQKALALNPYDNFTKQHLLQTHLEILSVNFALVNLRIMTSEEQDNIHFVLSLIAEQLDLVKDGELGKVRSKLLMAQGYLRGLLGEYKPAMDDFDAALESVIILWCLNIKGCRCSDSIAFLKPWRRLRELQISPKWLIYQLLWLKFIISLGEARKVLRY